jgi:hypothetical protein
MYATPVAQRLSRRGVRRNRAPKTDCRGRSDQGNLHSFQSEAALRPSLDLVLSLSFAGGVLLLIWLASAWWRGAFPFG